MCGQPFRGAFRDPPPRPPPAAALVASLHVDNTDQRTMLLADPVTGEVVARVAIPAGAEDLSGDEMLQQWRREVADGGGEGADEEERGSCGPAGSMACMALLIICLMGGFAWMSSAAGDGEPPLWSPGSAAGRCALDGGWQRVLHAFGCAWGYCMASLSNSALLRCAGSGEEEVFAGAWLIRIMLLFAWIFLRSVRPCESTLS